MKTSVYIPCYNAAATLGHVVDSVCAQTRHPDEIIVVNDGSTDATAAIVKSYASHGVRMVKQDINRGLAAARNRALAEATGDLLIGVDADVSMTPSYVQNVVATFSEHANLGAVCGRLIERYTSTVPDRWRAAHMSQDLGEHPQVTPRFLYGCTTSIRRRVAKQVGGWNERFTRAYEDADLTRRLREVGVICRFEPRLVAHHVRRDTVASVLTSFWHWFYPAGDLAGHYDSLERWSSDRLKPGPWSLFQHRLMQDRAQQRDALIPITLLMPWWMTYLDLAELHRRHAAHRDTLVAVMAALPEMIESVVSELGGSSAVADWMAQQAAALVAGDHRSHGAVAPAAASLSKAIRRTAAQSLAVANDLWATAETALPAVRSKAEHKERSGMIPGGAR